MSAASTQRELYGQLLPLQDDAVLLPRVAVLEIQGMDTVRVSTSGPGWLLGFAAWHSDTLPVVSLEAMAGSGVPSRSRRSRLTVLSGLGSQPGTDRFTIVTQGYPQLVPLNPQVLHRQPPRSEDAGVALTRVRLANTEALIPDLECIERGISEALRTVADGAAAAADWEPGASLDGDRQAANPGAGFEP